MRSTCLIAAFGLAISGLAGAGAFAQEADSLRQLEAGYNGSRAIESAAFNPITRDALGNRLIVNGVIQDTSGPVAYRSMPSTGAAYLISGAGAGAGAIDGQASVTAVGNLVSVTIAGNGNTVVLNASQTTGGDVTASLNGFKGTAPNGASQ